MSKEQIKSLVVQHKELGEKIYELWLSAPTIEEQALPGQFVSVYTDDASKVLPRPFSICEVNHDRGRIRIVYRVTGEGTGTEGFTRLLVGDTVRIVGPLGNSFPIDKAVAPEGEESRKVLVIGGGIGIYPLYELSKVLREKCGVENVSAVLGFRKTNVYLSYDFKKHTGLKNIYVATEDGRDGTKGTVIDLLNKYEADGKPIEADIIYACGPKPMLRAIAEYAEAKNIECYVSLEERMACGIGACLGCVCETTDKNDHSQVNNARVCKDGPVFNSREVVL